MNNVRNVMTQRYDRVLNLLDKKHKMILCIVGKNLATMGKSNLGTQYLILLKTIFNLKKKKTLKTQLELNKIMNMSLSSPNAHCNTRIL